MEMFSPMPVGGLPLEGIAGSKGIMSETEVIVNAERKVVSNSANLLLKRKEGILLNSGIGSKLGSLIPNLVYMAEHKKNARPSTFQKHQKGQTRGKQDREGSKGMKNPPRKRPPNHKGPWPPKNDT